MNPIDNNQQPTQPQQPAVYGYQSGQPTAPVQQPYPHHPQHPAANNMDDNHPITKLGGWLIVLVIALIVGVLFNLHGISDTVKLMDDALVQSIYSTYPGLEGALVFERSVFSLAAVAGIVAVVLVCMRKRVAKHFIIGFLVAAVIASIIDVATVNSIFKDSPEALAAVDGDNQVLRAIIAAGVWIPYLLRSKRVKRTLVK